MGFLPIFTVIYLSSFLPKLIFLIFLKSLFFIYYLFNLEGSKESRPFSVNPQPYPQIISAKIAGRNLGQKNFINVPTCIFCPDGLSTGLWTDRKRSIPDTHLGEILVMIKDNIIKNFYLKLKEI